MAPLSIEAIAGPTGGDPGTPAGTGMPLVMAHGFTQTARLWGPLAPALGAHRVLYGVDLPGHAGSGEVRATLADGATLLVDSARHLAPSGDGADGPGVVDRFDLLGYSLGARFALHAALQHPERVRRLVLIGATGGIEDPAARARRRAADEATADELESTGDVAGFLARWLAHPMFAGLGEGAGATQRLRNSAGGLASSLRLAGLGTQEPLWERLGGLTMPVLVVAGADDPRFVAHGTRLAGAAPDAVLALVPGAGHAAHLHQPALTARVVGRWLDAGD